MLVVGLNSYFDLFKKIQTQPTCNYAILTFKLNRHSSIFFFYEKEGRAKILGPSICITYMHVQVLNLFLSKIMF